MVWNSMKWYETTRDGWGMVWDGMGWYGIVQDGMGRYGMVWDGMGWYGMVWDGMGWYGMVYNGEDGKEGLFCKNVTE